MSSSLFGIVFLCIVIVVHCDVTITDAGGGVEVNTGGGRKPILVNQNEIIRVGPSCWKLVAKKFSMTKSCRDLGTFRNENPLGIWGMAIMINGAIRNGGFSVIFPSGRGIKIAFRRVPGPPQGIPPPQSGVRRKWSTEAETDEVDYVQSQYGITATKPQIDEALIKAGGDWDGAAKYLERQDTTLMNKYKSARPTTFNGKQVTIPDIIAEFSSSHHIPPKEAAELLGKNENNYAKTIHAADTCIKTIDGMIFRFWKQRVMHWLHLTNKDKLDDGAMPLVVARIYLARDENHVLNPALITYTNALKDNAIWMKKLAFWKDSIVRIAKGKDGGTSYDAHRVLDVIESLIDPSKQADVSQPISDVVWGNPYADASAPTNPFEGASAPPEPKVRYTSIPPPPQGIPPPPQGIPPPPHGIPPVDQDIAARVAYNNDYGRRDVRVQQAAHKVDDNEYYSMLADYYYDVELQNAREKRAYRLLNEERRNAQKYT